MISQKVSHSVRPVKPQLGRKLGNSSLKLGQLGFFSGQYKFFIYIVSRISPNPPNFPTQNLTFESEHLT